TVLGFSDLLVSDKRIPLCSEGIDLEDIRIASVMAGIDDDLEIIIQFLGKVAAELSGDRAACSRIMTRDADIDFIPRIQQPHFGSLGRWLAFVGLSLLEICNRKGL